MRTHHLLLPVAVLALGLGSAGAHLAGGGPTFSPMAPFTQGSIVKVGVTVTIVHDGVDIAFSSDNGKTWTNLKTNMPAPSKQAYSYNWTVGAPTTQGKIRVCQHNPDGCTDENSSDPSGNSTNGRSYFVVSPAFTIQ